MRSLRFNAGDTPAAQAEEIGLSLKTERKKDAFEWTFRFQTDPDHLTPNGFPPGNRRKGAALEDEQARDETSVNRANATLPLGLCCFYNACCCCLPKSLGFGPWCGRRFCFPACICFKVELRRDRWLWLLHLFCFGAHLSMAILTKVVATGDMRVELTRLESKWQNRGGEYKFEVVPLDESEQNFYIDTVTMLFFLLSATAHAVWVFISPFGFSIPLLWAKLDRGLCWWRWVEYSLSASVMMVGMAAVTAIRDRNLLLAIFALSFSTMICGLFTELNSKPHMNEDGSYDFNRWQGDPAPYTEGRYYATREARKRRWVNYMGRMLPHFLGFVPYVTGWFILISNFRSQIDDLCPRIQDRVPEFVEPLIYGSCVIFSLFTFVQQRYQYTAPREYWKTEVWYNVLSLTSKLYLGVFLLINVLQKSSFNDAVSLVGRENATNSGYNETAYCLFQSDVALDSGF